MARPIYQRVAVTDAGDVIPGAEYTVTNENTGTEQTIYDARSGGSVISQPAFADANGVIQFWTEPGVTYRVEATGGVGTYTDRYVEADTRMTDLSDPASGSLMPPGAFGLGTDNPPTAIGNDYNSVGAFQVAKFGGGQLNPPFGASDVAPVLAWANNASFTTQVAAKQNGTGLIKFRVQNNNVWQAWREIYHTGNLLGTVSQSGGVPTGAIIERGSNSNGEYVKFADGTLICRVKNLSAPDISSPSGSVFLSSSDSIWNFPLAFSEYPAVYGTRKAFTGVWVAAGSGDVTTTFASFRLARGTSFSGATLTFDAVAIGRWF